MGVIVDLTILTSDPMVHIIVAASGLLDNFSLYIQFHVLGGWNCSIVVRWVLFRFMLSPSGWWIGRGACCSARFCSMLTLLCGMLCHDLLQWMWRENENQKKWEVLSKKITNWSGKYWGRYSERQVKMGCVTADLHVLRKLNPAVYSC